MVLILCHCLTEREVRVAVQVNANMRRLCVCKGKYWPVHYLAHEIRRVPQNYEICFLSDIYKEYLLFLGCASAGGPGLVTLCLDFLRHNPEGIKLSKKCIQTNKPNKFKLSSRIIQISTVASGNWPE